MKFRFVIAVVAAAALSGCSEKNSDSPVLADGNVELTLSVPCTATKVSGVPSSEDAIKDLQVLVFNSKGMLETYKHGNGNIMSLTCTAGEKRIAVFVNAGQQNSVGYERELPQLASDLTDNGPGRLVMAGDTSVVLTASGSLNLEVRRMAARIGISKIENAMVLPQHKAMKFEVKSLYLVNVPGDRAFFGVSETSRWYNCSAPQVGSPSFLRDDVTGGVVAAGKAYEGKHYFYCYPNDVTEDSSAAEWCPRKTRLVAEVALDDVTYYYPVTLDNVARNTSYSYELRITRPGSSSPDIPVDDAAVGITVVVKGWSELPPVHEQI